MLRHVVVLSMADTGNDGADPYDDCWSVSTCGWDVERRMMATNGLMAIAFSSRNAH